MPSKLGDVGKLPTSNALGNVGEAQNNAQHLQNTRQHSANYRSAQTQFPNTPAGQDAFHAWNQRNPAPVKQDLGHQQQNVQNYVDQDVVNRGAGLGFAHAQARLRGQQPNAPQLSEADQHAQHNQVMADIKREQANGGIQNSRVNTINPSKPIDINGERRRIEAKNGWPRGSMDQGGEHYAANGQRSAQLVKENGPSGIPQPPVSAPSPAPVAQATPAPTSQPWKSKEAEKMYNDSVNKPNSGYNGNINMGGGSLGGAAAQRPQISSLSPEQDNALSDFQAKNNERMKSEGSTRPPDDYTKLSPGQQKYVHDFNLERGNIPRPERPPTGQVPNPINPNKDMNDRPMRPRPQNQNPVEQKVTPVKPPKPMWKDPGSPPKLNDGLPLMRGGENLLNIKPQGVNLPPAPTIKPNPSLTPPPQRPFIKPSAPPPSGLKGTVSPKAPQSISKPSYSLDDEKHYKFPTVEDLANPPPSSPRPPRITQPNFKEGVNFQSPVMQKFNTFKPEANAIPPIKKSSPITDTIKASNNPVPVVNSPKPAQQAPAQRKPLFPRLRGRR